MNSSDYISEEEIDDWFDAEDEFLDSPKLTDEELSQKYSETQVRIVRSSLDFTLHTLSSSIKDKSYIDISPGYQRRARWDRKKKSLLIESFLMNVPVPPIFLFEKDYNQYEIMDGRQRLEAISEYLDNQYPLAGLEYWPELNGKRFNELPGTIQRGLLRRTISAVVLLAETETSDEDFDIRMILFGRLNTGGVKLNPQELRNALYPGLFNQALHEMSRHDLFADSWGIPRRKLDEDSFPSVELQKNVLFRSMMDCEIVLRFYAVRNIVHGRVGGSMRKALDKTMEIYSKNSAHQIEVIKNEFLSTLKRVSDSLGINFHHLPQTQKPSRPLYDAFLVAAYELPDIDLSSNAVEIRRRLDERLGESDAYGILVGKGNTTESVRERVKLAKQIIEG